MAKIDSKLGLLFPDIHINLLGKLNITFLFEPFFFIFNLLIALLNVESNLNEITNFWKSFDLWTLVSTTTLNPFALAGSFMAEFNALLPGFYYVRPTTTPPSSWWGVIFGFVYNIYWKQFIWTWEPFDSYLKYLIKAAEATGDGGLSWVLFF
jgi:hypothetical protein